MKKKTNWKIVRPSEKYLIHNKFRKNVIQNENFYGVQDGKCFFPCNKNYLLAQRKGMVVYFVKIRHAMSDEGLYFSNLQAENKVQNNWVDLQPC